VSSFVTLDRPTVDFSARRVRIVQVDPPGPEVIARWEPPDLGRYDGDPRWDTWQRPGRVDGQEYVGQQLHTRPVDLLFDGWAKGPRGGHLSVEADCRTVHGWSIPVGGVGSGQWPPRLRVIYGPWQQIIWRVGRLRWGRPLFIDGTRVRQDVRVELVEYHDPSLLLSPVEQAQAAATAAAPGRYQRPGSGRTYTVKAGDSLYRIATAELGDATRWREIAELNAIRDPYVLQVGQVLRLPA
jgi:hypothetical protein